MTDLIKRALQVRMWSMHFVTPISHRVDYSEIAYKLMSVEPLKKPVGKIFSLDYKHKGLR